MNKKREIIIGLFLALLPILGVYYSYNQGDLQSLENRTIDERYRLLPLIER